MKILLLHNSYGQFSGEEAVVEMQKILLEAHGHTVECYSRSSAGIKGPGGKINAFFSGFYNARSIREVREMISGGQPDIVHIHNLFPLISPAILPLIKSLNNPSTHQLINSSAHQLISSPAKLVMTIHNYRLICPNGLFFTHDEICERCSGGREWNCILHNCEYSALKSTGYALRNLWARRRRFYLDNVDAFLCLTEFQKIKLTENGFPGERCHILPNFVTPATALTQEFSKPGYVLFAGRLNTQKGFGLLAQAASLIPDIPVRVAGEGKPDYLKTLSIPVNMELKGKLDTARMNATYQEAAFLVFPVRSYEGFPMVFPEAMQHRLPVIAPDMAGFPEIIEDGVNGLLFKPGDAADLASKIRLLWENKDLREKLGRAGERKLQTEYSAEVYYKKLMDVYKDVTRNA